ncbi:MAG TPA: hypothetical protein DEO40_06945 [Treponema sp.]|jgi:hypothetical protein|nr:hypothetical protein [Treponema sp.]
MKDDLIEEFVAKSSLDALSVLISADDVKKVRESSVLVAESFQCSGNGFGPVAAGENDAEEKLVNSFYNNLILLIQKTWVEKSDEDLKAQVLYQLQEFVKQISVKSYCQSYRLFLDIVGTTVYLMFGSQTKSKDFAEYALRIDPEFGIFWWYIKSLPGDAEWSEEKTRVAILLGMYFLANY